MRRLLFRILILLGLLAAPGFALAQGGPQRSERIEAELVSMSRWAAPGGTPTGAIRATAAARRP